MNNDIAHEFNSRNRELKSTAMGAFHKRNGSKSRKCGLPSDHLTAAQLRQKNGPITEFNLDKPMSAENFKQLSEAQKKLYLGYLIKTYGANDRMLSMMLGYDPSYIAFIRRSLGLKSGSGVGKRPAPGAEERWRAFLGYEEQPQTPVEEAPAVVEEEAAVVEEAPVVVEEAPTLPIEEDKPVEVAEKLASPVVKKIEMAMVIEGVCDKADLEAYLNLLPFRKDFPSTVRICVEQ